MHCCDAQVRLDAADDARTYSIGTQSCSPPPPGVGFGHMGAPKDRLTQDGAPWRPFEDSGTLVKPLRTARNPGAIYAACERRLLEIYRLGAAVRGAERRLQCAERL